MARRSAARRFSKERSSVVVPESGGFNVDGGLGLVSAITVPPPVRDRDS